MNLVEKLGKKVVEQQNFLPSFSSENAAAC